MKTLLRKVFPHFYHQLAMLLSKPSAWQLEKKRLLHSERYIEGYSNILGTPILYSDNLSFIASFEEIFEQKQYQFKSSHDNPVIVDVGSNIGLSVLYFKQLFPHALITAIEPDPNLFRILQSNIRSFGYTDVILHNNGVWEETGQFGFKQDFGTGGHIETSNKMYDQKLVKVGMRKLSEYLQSPVDLLKIDIEGAEWVCLQESEQLLKNTNNIIIEHHTKINETSTLHLVLTMLKLQGFRYYIREAFCPKQPLCSVELNGTFDLQVNIFGTRNY